MITVGLPKGLFYFQHHVLWETFFKNIGCQVIVSEDTNKDILDYGIKHCSNETCLPVKAFHGHVYNLKDKVDYIFIPRYTSIDKNEYTCPKFCGLPDMTLLNLKNSVKVLEIKFHLDHSTKHTYKSLKEVSKTLNIKYSYVVDAFRDALNVFTLSQKEALNSIKLNTIENSSKLSISVIGHPYIIYDNYLSMKLIKKLADRNIKVYTPSDLSHETKRQFAYPFQGKVFWEIGFDNLGTVFALAENKSVDGIIYLTPFACGLDSIIIEFIERRLKANYNMPFLKLTIDEHSGEAGFDTRIEAFIDMVG